MEIEPASLNGGHTLVPMIQPRTQKDPLGCARGTVVMLVGQLAFGGAERHMITLANALSEQFNVVLAYLKSGEALLDQLRTESLLEVRCLKVSKRVDLRAARELAQIADRYCAQLILCANEYALMYAHLARALAGSSPAVAEVFHTTRPSSLKERLSLMLYRPFFWCTHHLVFVCQAQRRYWLRRGLWARQVHTIYNGVDASHFDPIAFEGKIAAARRSFGFGAHDRVVGICAVLRPEKAHADLLSAVATLRDEGCDWRVLIIGDGPRRAALEAEVARLDLVDHVKITGLQSDVRDSLAACDVVALVSIRETFSIAALEAMAMGKPMIMSDVGGAREQVEHGVNGYLFPAGDVHALAQCLRESSDTSRLRQLGSEARKRVVRRFSQRSMLESYATLIDRIVTPKEQTFRSR
ncbi:MAG: glycosyltransferase family 4 protein [Burkholderiaceae bacterium]